MNTTTTRTEKMKARLARFTANERPVPEVPVPPTTIETFVERVYDYLEPFNDIVENLTGNEWDTDRYVPEFYNEVCLPPEWEPSPNARIVGPPMCGFTAQQVIEIQTRFRHLNRPPP